MLEIIEWMKHTQMPAKAHHCLNENLSHGRSLAGNDNRETGSSRASPVVSDGEVVVILCIALYAVLADETSPSRSFLCIKCPLLNNSY